MHTIEKPWGRYTVLFDSNDIKVKHLTILSGKRISLQYHENRSEYWKIVSCDKAILLKGLGIGNLQCYPIRPGMEIQIPKKMLHRLEALSGDLDLIEIQEGDNSEEDIVRVHDDYGR